MSNIQVQYPVPIAVIEDFFEENIKNMVLPTTSCLGNSVGDIVKYHGRVQIIGELGAQNNVAKFFPIQEVGKSVETDFHLSVSPKLPSVANMRNVKYQCEQS